MRILHVDKFHRRFGGAAGYMFDVAELLRSDGHEVEFFGAAHPDNVPATYGHLFPDVAGYDPPPDGIVSKVAASASMFWSVRAARAMAAVADEFRPDLVHVHNIYHQLSPSILRPLRERGIPVVMTVHDFKLVCPTYRLHDGTASCEACLGGKFRNAVQRRCKSGSRVQSAVLAAETATHRRLDAYGSIDTFICPSQFLLDKLLEGGFAPERLRHIPNFTQMEPVAAPQPRRSATVLNFGRMSNEKGVDTLIEACASDPARELRIAGDGPQLAELRALADRIAPGRVTFLGQLDRPSLTAEIDRAGVVVFPARGYENMPLAIIEAMARGVPVITTDIGGSPELLTDGVGVCVPPDDAAALRAAIDRFDDDTLRHSCAAAGLQRLIEQYSPAPHLRLLNELYGEVLARSRAVTA